MEFAINAIREIPAGIPGKSFHTRSAERMTLIGDGPGLQAVRRAVGQVAPTDASVLITGETGTGKELVARMVHEASRRNAQAFVAVSGVALSPTLVTSELFGHEVGAFTGAVRRRIGRFEQAHGGTLFLDEIGELPLETQSLLLRTLQERTIERVGGETVAVDVRIVSATNRDLQNEVAHSRFRMDLYYRLNVFPIHLPPLRERPEDIPALASGFVPTFAARHGKSVTSIAPAAMRSLITYHWPGNIRELQNLIERAVIVSEGSTLQFDPAWLAGTSVVETATTWAAQEKQRIVDALRQAGGRVYGPGGAAQRLGLKPTTLYGKMQKHNLSRSHDHWR